MIIGMASKRYKKVSNFCCPRQEIDPFFFTKRVKKTQGNRCTHKYHNDGYIYMCLAYTLCSKSHRTLWLSSDNYVHPSHNKEPRRPVDLHFLYVPKGQTASIQDHIAVLYQSTTPQRKTQICQITSKSEDRGEDNRAEDAAAAAFSSIQAADELYATYTHTTTISSLKHLFYFYT